MWKNAVEADFAQWAYQARNTDIAARRSDRRWKDTDTIAKDLPRTPGYMLTQKLYQRFMRDGYTQGQLLYSQIYPEKAYYSSDTFDQAYHVMDKIQRQLYQWYAIHKIDIQDIPSLQYMKKMVVT